MRRLNRYPHKLYGIISSSTTVKDEFGQDVIVEGSEEAVFICDCYEQVLGAAKEIRLDNGEIKVCSSVIFTPFRTDIQEGEIIEIRDTDGTQRLRGEIKRNSGADFKHSRLWV